MIFTNLLTIEDEISHLKAYYANILPTQKSIIGRFFGESTIKKYPMLYEKFKILSKEEKKEFGYDILFVVTTKPKCLVCGKPTKLRNFAEGYTTYCSTACTNKHAFSTPEFRKKISEGISRKYNENYYREKYIHATEKTGENFLVKNYCKLGDFYINKNKYERLINEKANLCEKCAIENITLKVVDYSLGKFLNEIPYRIRYPEMYNTIIANCKESTASFSEKRFMELNKIEKRPICPICNIRETKYIGSFSGYTKTCTEKTCILTSSSEEKNIYDLVKLSFPDAISGFKLDNNELDIYIPSLKIGIEYNGLYWHSENFRKINYHIDKTNFFEAHGIQLITIWEDDWLFKPEIVKSIIFNKLVKSDRIFARKCILKIVSSEETKKFLNENHLQGECNDSIRYGLFYENELVSLMTFGKSRMILNSDTIENNYELLRFCNKLNFTVIGGASKLFNYFKKNNKFENIISYANRDISTGKLYKKLGFNLVKKTKPGYWWCKDNHKFHRSNFMKHKIVAKEDYDSTSESQEMIARGYFKVWNAGNLKYIYSNCAIFNTDKIKD